MIKTNTKSASSHYFMPNFSQSKFGTAFKVTHQGIESYLIGVTHNSNEEMITQSCFHRILDQCSTLYTEAGVNIFVTSPHLNIPEHDHAYKHIKDRFSLDDAITLEAWFRKIPILSLDQEVAEINQTTDQWIQKHSQGDPRILEQEMMAAAEKLAGFSVFAVLQSDTLKGKIRKLSALKTRILQKDPSFTNSDIREERWSQILIPVIRNTQTPICIAVGAAHVVGKGSLTNRFKKAGFKVEFIRSDCPSDQARFTPPSTLAPRSFFSSPGWLPFLMQQRSADDAQSQQINQVKRALPKPSKTLSKRSRSTEDTSSQSKITRYF